MGDLGRRRVAPEQRRPYSQVMVRSAARVASLLAVAALAASPVGAQAAHKPSVKAPKDGAVYSGDTDRGGKFSVSIAGKSIEIAVIQFKCHDTIGHTSLQDIPLKKTKRGYKFGISAHGIVSYDDGHPDQNAPIEIWGQFTRRAKSAKGTLRVRAPRCGTGALGWKITR
jgi:hypothetical protein